MSYTDRPLMPRSPRKILEHYAAEHAVHQASLLDQDPRHGMPQGPNHINPTVAARHYEVPFAPVADVVCGEDEYGVWVRPVETVALPADPYPGGVPHVARSDTSIAAARSMTDRRGPMQARILELLRHASDGMTCDAIEERTGWAHQSASARVRELVLDELVIDSGRRRKGRSGRTGRVYVLRAGRPAS